MKQFFATAFFLMICAISIAQTSTNNRYYELRIYYCNPGRLDALLQRFQNHTLKLFEKHGMENVGYWVPTTPDNNILYYILAFPDRAARDASFKSFVADPEWKEVAAKSEESGKIIEKIVSVYMKGADVLPMINASAESPERSFELRTYTCYPGKFPDIVSRFKNHTLKLFEKHGKQNIAYFATEEPDGEQSKLVYLVAHKSEEAAAASWAAFRADPEWIKVKEDSEKAGKIVEKSESVFMKPTAFSKIK
jgi:uncharacterized protein YbaA (DUF1428 family)